MIKLELDDDLALWLKQQLENYITEYYDDHLQDTTNATKIIGKIIQGRIDTKVRKNEYL